MADDRPSVRWLDRGERVWARLVCGECRGSRVIDLGPRFELAATPQNHAVDAATRRAQRAVGDSLVAHHLPHLDAAAALAAAAACDRMGLYAPCPAVGDLGPLVVLVCETATLVTAWPGDHHLQQLDLLFRASDADPLATAAERLRGTFAEGLEREAAERAVAWRAWRPVG